MSTRCGDQSAVRDNATVSGAVTDISSGAISACREKVTHASVGLSRTASRPCQKANFTVRVARRRRQGELVYRKANYRRLQSPLAYLNAKISVCHSIQPLGRGGMWRQIQIRPEIHYAHGSSASLCVRLVCGTMALCSKANLPWPVGNKERPRFSR